jgi:hypothetical protein
MRGARDEGLAQTSGAKPLNSKGVVNSLSLEFVLPH